MKGANVKHGTRGRKRAFVIPRTKTSETRRTLDLNSIAVVWRIKSLEPPQEMLQRLSDRVEGARAAQGGSAYYSADAPTGKAIERVRKAASKLLADLESLERLDGGSDVIDGLAIVSSVFHPDTLKGEIASAFRTGQPAELCRGFVRDVYVLFMEYDQNTAIHETSLFVSVLKEIERQFPGVPRPSPDPLAQWRSYVSAAIAENGTKIA